MAANENIGRIQCTIVIDGYVRKKKTGKHALYIHDKRYHNLFMQTELGQDFILENAEIFGEGGEKEPAPEPEKKPGPEPEKKPGPEPEKKEKNSGFGVW